MREPLSHQSIQDLLAGRNWNPRLRARVLAVIIALGGEETTALPGVVPRQIASTWANKQALAYLKEAGFPMSPGAFRRLKAYVRREWPGVISNIGVACTAADLIKQNPSALEERIGQLRRIAADEPIILWPRRLKEFLGLPHGKADSPKILTSLEIDLRREALARFLPSVGSEHRQAWADCVSEALGTPRPAPRGMANISRRRLISRLAKGKL